MRMVVVTVVLALLVLSVFLAACTSSGCGFCSSPNQCCKDTCMIPCPEGQFRDYDDCLCYPESVVRCDCGDYKYCEAGGKCCNNRWIKCPDGSFLGTDCLCYDEGTVKCNCGIYSYCKSGGQCCNNEWIICPPGTFLGDDCYCYQNGTVKCNCGGEMYCAPGGQCCNNQWLTCPAGQKLTKECYCMPIR